MARTDIRTTPHNFEVDFLKLMKQYTDDVVEAMTEETRNTAENGAETLRNVRQPDATEGGTAKPMKRRQWRKYSRSWKVKEFDGTNFYRAIIHNSKHYRLTHLLEYGHMTRNGKKTRAFAHIQPVDEAVAKRLTEIIPKIIEKGGKL